MLLVKVSSAIIHQLITSVSLVNFSFEIHNVTRASTFDRLQKFSDFSFEFTIISRTNILTKMNS